MVGLRRSPPAARDAGARVQREPMSADKPKPPPKPFLGAEELSSELDAWDDMFDSLHASDEAPAAAEPMAWPAERAQTVPTPPPAGRVPDADLGASEGSQTLDDFGPGFSERAENEIEEQ